MNDLNNLHHLSRETYEKEYWQYIDDNAVELSSYKNLYVISDEGIEYKKNCVDVIEDEEKLKLIGLMLLADLRTGFDKKRLIDICASRLEDDLRDRLENLHIMYENY